MIDNYLFNLADKISFKLGWRMEKGEMNDKSSIVASVTTRCNFNCPHCLRQLNDKNKSKFVDLQPEIFAIALSEGKKIYCTHAAITGGEPILNPRLGEFIELIKKYGYTYNLVSNGWLYKEYWPLIKDHKKNLTHIALSLDGATAATHDKVRQKPGSYNKIIEALEFYREKRINLLIVFNFTRDNYLQAEAMIKLCLFNKIPTIKFGAIMDINGQNNYCLTREQRNSVYRQIIELRNKFKNKINILTATNLISVLSPVSLNSTAFCPVLKSRNQYYIDHDGAMLFCCDIYKECPTKPFINSLGFKECLKINFDVVNEIIKKQTTDLLDNKLPEVSNFCEYCNNCAEEFFR